MKTQEEMTLKLRELAGKIGEMMEQDPGLSDSENYEYQVHLGLAEAVVEILEYDITSLFHWFGYCLIGFPGITMEEGDPMRAMLDDMKEAAEQIVEENMDEE